MTIPPIFIIGCPRSGTSLLAKLLEPTIYGSPVETHFITKFYNKLSRYGHLKEKRNFTKLTRAILRQRPVMQWRLHVNIDRLWRHSKTYDYQELVHNLCMMRFNALGKQSWGDKTPHYILHLNIINDLFPDSKYLYIVRDGRDVALSLLKKPWGQNNIYACAEYWKKCNELSETIQLIQKRGNLLNIKYETLLERPTDAVEGFYAFLGERFSDQGLKSIIGSIKSSNFNKWKKEMKPKDVKLFETVAANTLQSFGYETSFPESALKTPVKWIWKIHDYILTSKHLAKINLIDTIRIKYFGMDPFGD
jgi:hypothetical protein